MSNVEIQPIRSYQDGGKFLNARSKPYVVELRHAKQLQANGLCVILEGSSPQSPTGGQSSASPAAPASPQPTAPASENGGARRGRKKVGA